MVGWCALLSAVYMGSFIVIGVLYQKGLIPEGLSLPFRVLYAPFRWLAQNVPIAQDMFAWLFHVLGGK
ncbi:hypothetical protein [Planctomyces sp. SH-PL14]|uniref:hypothetical protein n=1 Tax=Planctomyces sp. SH-PL14 TaxID=1632864 RepID=UPI00094658B4|nr:hypothetical protein [Planctomyces sp. SH-PL14]